LDLRLIGTRGTARRAALEPGPRRALEEPEERRARTKRARERALLGRALGAVRRARDREQLRDRERRVEVVLEGGDDRGRQLVRWSVGCILVEAGVTQHAVHSIELLRGFGNELRCPLERLSVVRGEERE